MLKDEVLASAGIIKNQAAALNKRAVLGRHATRQALLSIEMGERL